MSRRSLGAVEGVENGENCSGTAFHSRAPVRLDHTKRTIPVDCSIQIHRSTSFPPLRPSADIADFPSSARSAYEIRRWRFVERRGFVVRSDLQFGANLDRSVLAVIAMDDTAEPAHRRSCQYVATTPTTTRNASFETHRVLIRSSTIRRTWRTRRVEPRRLSADIAIRTGFLLLRPTRSLPRSRRRIFHSSFRIRR